MERLQKHRLFKGARLPTATKNEISALTLLALCNIKEDDSWANATGESKRISKEIMEFVYTNYRADNPYAPNTRETFRRQVLHQFVQGAVANYNPDIPDLPVNSPRAHYAMTPEALEVVRAFGTPNGKTLPRSSVACTRCFEMSMQENGIRTEFPSKSTESSISFPRGSTTKSRLLS